MQHRYIVASAVALTIGGWFLFVGDGTDRGAHTTGFEYAILAYFHALTWLLLSLYFLLRSYGMSNAKYIAYAALFSYLLFIIIRFAQ